MLAALLGLQKANATLQRIAKGMLATLTPREREVLNLRFGIPKGK
jgi:DNA-directed RNA polymerase sigma subunit (sigma70/sigma32)